MYQLILTSPSYLRETYKLLNAKVFFIPFFLLIAPIAYYVLTLLLVPRIFNQVKK